jgi:hypothetical protein
MNNRSLDPAWGLWMCAAIAAMALSACGGGNSSGQPPPPPPKPTGNGSYFSLSTEYSDATGLKVMVVDLRTSKVELTLGGTQAGSDVPLQTSERYQLVNNSTAQYLGLSQLFVIENGRLVQRDLSGEALGAPQVISGFTNACDLYSQHTTNLAGTTGWIEVEIAGADGDCRRVSDNERRLVPFGANTSDLGKLTDSQGLEWVNHIQTSLDGPVLGILAVDRAAGLLNVYDKDLRQTLSNVALPRALGATEHVEVIYTWPDGSGRKLIQIGQSLYVATLSGTQLALGKPVHQLTTTSWVETPSDGQNVYLADVADILRITPDGDVQVIAQADSGKGAILRMMLSAGSLIIQQSTTPPGSAPSIQTITAYAVNTGLPTLLAQGNADTSVSLLSASGSNIWVEEFDRKTYLSDIVRKRIDGSNQTRLIAGTYYISELIEPNLSVNSGLQVSHVLGCPADAGSESCDGKAIMLYDLATGNAVNLGSITLEAGWSWGNAYSKELSTVEMPSLLNLSQFKSTNGSSMYRTSTLYFAPGVVGSLKILGG